jgi:two-component system chemotaxis sensor kinase CheA
LAAKAGTTTTDPEKLKELLFSGISTAENVTEISGRGVGLGAVKKDVEAVGGAVAVISEPGQGTTFQITLPLSLSVIQALVVRVDGQHYGIPASVVDRSIKIPVSQYKKIAGQEVFVLDGAEIPLLALRQKFGLQDENVPYAPAIDNLAVIVTAGEERIGLVVDAIIEASQVIVKPVPAILKNNRAFGGTTILGNGKSALLINPQGLL